MRHEIINNSIEINHYYEFHEGWYPYTKNWIIRKYLDYKWPEDKPLPLGILYSYNWLVKHVKLEFSRNPLKHLWVFGDREYEKGLELELTTPEFLHKCGHFSLYIDYQSSPVQSGTLAMPNHNYNGITVNFEEYCKLLNELPQKFKPITMCLHENMSQYIPIVKNMDFDIIGSGKHQPLFLKHQLEMISHFKYLTTTYDGTPLWYALLVGTRPFYLGQLTKKKPNGTIFIEKDITNELLFHIDNVDKKMDAKQKKLDLHFGINYKKTPEELLTLFNKLQEDFNYQYLLHLLNLNKTRPQKFMCKTFTRYPEKKKQAKIHIGPYPAEYELKALQKYSAFSQFAIETGSGRTTHWLSKSIKNTFVTINIKPLANIPDNVIFKQGWSVTIEDLKKYNINAKKKCEHGFYPDYNLLMGEESGLEQNLLCKTIQEYPDKKLDFFFCDTGEYSANAEWSIVKNKIKIKGFVALHDIYYPKSIKCYKIYEEIKHSPNWKICLQTDTPQGLLIAQKIK